MKRSKPTVRVNRTNYQYAIGNARGNKMRIDVFWTAKASGRVCGETEVWGLERSVELCWRFEILNAYGKNAVSPVADETALEALF